MSETDLYPDKENISRLKINRHRAYFKKYSIIALFLIVIIVMLAFFNGIFQNQPQRTTIELLTDIPDIENLDIEFLNNISVNSFRLNNIDYEFSAHPSRWPEIGGHDIVTIVLKLKPEIPLEIVTFWLYYQDVLFKQDNTFDVTFDLYPGKIYTPHFWDCNNNVNVYVLFKLVPSGKFIFLGDFGKTIRCV